MGFNASLITIRQPGTGISNEELLQQLGFTKITDRGETTFEECMCPRDNSMNIGRYNDCIVISDDYVLSTDQERIPDPQRCAEYELVLSRLFPGCEILTAACVSAVNYHMYSLVKDGVKLRYKRVAHDQPLVEWGERLAEEEPVYAVSKMIDGERLFKSSFDEDDTVYDNTEDQMMEDFTFGVARRHLGVYISTDEDEELTFSTPFRKYAVSRARKAAPPIAPDAVAPKKTSWLSRLFGRS